MNNPVLGASYLLEGFNLIFKPKIRRFVLIPALINILIYSGLFAIAYHYFVQFTAWLQTQLPHYLQWLHWLLWPLFILGCLILAAYTFTMLANLLAAPFNSLLAEKVEMYLGGRPPSADESIMQAVKDVPRVLKRELSKIAYYIPRALLILLLYLIPLANVAAPLAAFLFGAWMMAVQYIDYPFDNHRTTFQHTRDWLAKHLFGSFGFGAAITVCLMIPFVNFLTIPAAIAGAVKFFHEQQAA